MDPQNAFLTDVIVSLAVSTTLVSMLDRPLQLILRQICPLADAHSFWRVFTALSLFLLPLIFTLMWLPSTPMLEPVWVIRHALLWACVGAFAALLAIGFQLARARAPVIAQTPPTAAMP